MSLLLFALAAPFLLFLSTRASYFRSLHQLLNETRLFLLVLGLHCFPHLVNFVAARVFGFLLHTSLLPGSLLLQVVLLKRVVLRAHLLAFTPL